MEQKNTYLNNNIEYQVCNSDLHFTYNPLKKKYLKEKGVRYVKSDINPNTGKRYWCYKKGEILDYALKLWKEYQDERFKKK